MKTILIFVLISASCFSNILIIGDSHMAGPFGRNLHSNIVNSSNENTATFGHASSAPKDWLNPIQLSGGVFNSAYINSKTLTNPDPTHWRVKVNVPSIDTLLSDMTYHAEWKINFPALIKPSVVVMGLGANDARAISNPQGIINNNNYKNRLVKMRLLISKVLATGAKCIWITPPMGRKKTIENQAVLYKMIYEAVGESCPIFNSNHYNVQGCDGVHMNCRSEYGNAKAWALEAAEFILHHL